MAMEKSEDQNLCFMGLMVSLRICCIGISRLEADVLSLQHLRALQCLSTSKSRVSDAVQELNLRLLEVIQRWSQWMSFLDVLPTELEFSTSGLL
jgi:hypothetical protein